MKFDIIFDIDGTLADCTHRVHWVTTRPKNWSAFDAGIPNDSPMEDIIYLNKMFSNLGHKIAIVTGRSERQRMATIDWLSQYEICYETLRMRKDNDFRADYIIKEEILNLMLEEGWNPKMVFDDRQTVVNMWRRRGIRCLQVAAGDF
jgi:FMN phosphatase YigB (HAD superfamily)